MFCFLFHIFITISLCRFDQLLGLLYLTLQLMSPWLKQPNNYALKYNIFSTVLALMTKIFLYDVHNVQCSAPFVSPREGWGQTTVTMDLGAGVIIVCESWIRDHADIIVWSEQRQQIQRKTLKNRGKAKGRKQVWVLYRLLWGHEKLIC